MRIPTATALIEARLNEADQGMINQFHDHLAEKGFKRIPDRRLHHTSTMLTNPSDHSHGSEPWQHGTKVQTFMHGNGQVAVLKPLDDGTVEYRTRSPNHETGVPPTKLGTDFSEFKSTLAAGIPTKVVMPSKEFMARRLRARWGT